MMVKLIPLLVISALASYFGGSDIDTGFITYVAVVFSILAGFVLAAITLLGEPGLLTPGTWRDGQFDLERIKDNLSWYRWLFLLYIFILLVGGLHFFSSSLPPQILKIIKKAFLFLTALNFGLSFGLPFSLANLQLGRLRAEINRKKLEELESLKLE